MKRFNLEEYLKNPSKKVITRDGRNVTIHCTNYDAPYPIIAEVEGLGESYGYFPNGKIHSNLDSLEDLFFVTEKHEGWVNIFKGTIDDYFIGDSRVFESKEEAEKAGKEWSGYMPVKIEWDE